MKKSPMCTYSCCAHQKYGNRTLSAFIRAFVDGQKKYFNLKRAGQKRVFVARIRASLKSGEGIIGYNYLHGTDMEAGGGLDMRIVAERTQFCIRVPVECTFKDLINVNRKYGTDVLKGIVAYFVPFASPRKYMIQISWIESFAYWG